VTVAKGDTLSAIAGRVLGDENRWHELFDANRDKLRDPHRLAEGMTLRLPGAAPAPAAPKTSDICKFDPNALAGLRDILVQATDEAEKFANQGPTTYTVKKGDSLSRIASKLLGDAGRWQEIRDANPDLLKGGSGLQPGMVLTMPDSAKEVLQRNATDAGEEGPVQSGRLWDMARDLGEKYDLDPRLVMAVVQKESGGNPRARSHVGAKGLMQLMPDTARSLGVKDAYDAQANMKAGTKYLKSLIDDFGDVRLGLMAYNWGPGNVRSYLKGHKKPPKETRNYVPAVLAYYRQFGGKA
jgi:LysM repeat protein